MRDIRFRAWFNSKPTWCNQMFYSDEEDFLGDWFNECESAKTSANLPISCVFMQFTGLCDKNDKEIYGGDIVKITRSIRTGSRRCKSGRRYETYAINSTLTFNGVVKIGEYKVLLSNCAYIAYVDTQFSTNYPSYFWGEGKKTDKPKLIQTNYTEALRADREYEVIGNIHENPELIEEKK